MGLTNIQRERDQKRKKTAKSRTAPRFDASSMPVLKSISQAGGLKVELINISRRGALIEGRNRLSPGSTVSLQLTSEKAVYYIKGRVVRSKASLKNSRLFQSGITFNKDFTILPAGTDKDPGSYLEALLQIVAD